MHLLGMEGQLFSICALLFLTNCVTGDIGYFWHVTDFHYDPTYNRTSLSCQESNGGNQMGRFGNMWCDSPWVLIESSVKAMYSIKTDIDFLLWTGDTVLHASVKDLNHQFNSVILDNVTDLLKTTFPKKPVYASFGNHDSYPSDQFKPKNTVLYNESLARWRSWINDSSQDANFRKGGFYSVKTPQNIRIVALNTVLYYIPNKAVQSDGDPAGQFAWLTQILEAARKQKERVIITAHIAPGVTPTGKSELYKHQNDRLVEIMKEYCDVIIAMHFGHEHADAFKVLKNKAGVPVSPVFLAPSVTPIRFGPVHNPGIRLVKYDRSTGQHLGISQYYLDLSKANNAGRADWKLEYTTASTYGLQDLSAGKLSSLTDKMRDPDSLEFKTYWKYYVVSPSEELTDACNSTCHASVVCGLTEFIKADFDKCVAEMLTSSAMQLSYWVPLFGISVMLLVFC
ncbi:acid sphingomyelinase-like phosphodiesterase 3a [Mercenaria mercenaria]|uniref:acid sphingomyelinase-like phosphodiesterase 3a n=1 Tax=Mercenaria mercenaria TaxID=6596 RepID=UPI001E1D2D72|nr:acid sphingomyelinase-like phosphodiesterase 3a [Mercenaria mercenaria]